jgi:hypothetical protein
MHKYLNDFQRQIRVSADAELISRWESSARYYGDRDIKIQLASAKRTATTLVKSATQFSNLKPEHELAIKAAANAMRSLAEELSVLAVWAKKYKIFCDQQRELEKISRLDELAAKRWGGDPKVFAFEFDLVNELCTKDGQLQFAAWIHSSGLFRDVKPENLTCRVDKLHEGKSPQHRLAQTIVEFSDSDRYSPDHAWTGFRGEKIAICSFAKYEEYLRYRQSIQKTASLLLESVSLSTPQELGGLR